MLDRDAGKFVVAFLPKVEKLLLVLAKAGVFSGAEADSEESFAVVKNRPKTNNI